MAFQTDQLTTILVLLIVDILLVFSGRAISPPFFSPGLLPTLRHLIIVLILMSVFLFFRFRYSRELEEYHESKYAYWLSPGPVKDGNLYSTHKATSNSDSSVTLSLCGWVESNYSSEWGPVFSRYGGTLPIGNPRSSTTGKTRSVSFLESSSSMVQSTSRPTSRFYSTDKLTSDEPESVMSSSSREILGAWLDLGMGMSEPTLIRNEPAQGPVAMPVPIVKRPDSAVLPDFPPIAMGAQPGSARKIDGGTGL